MSSLACEERPPERLIERVLEKLGFSSKPAVDRAGLAALYSAWCRSVPFDNTRKLIAVRANDPSRLPGDAPVDFLESWLADGTGGTCWAMHGAWTVVLEACGFRARRGLATMLVAPNIPPNHGTASVALGGETLLVDACIQHGDPVALEPDGETQIAHPAWGVRARPEGGRWLVHWRSPFAPGGMDCRIDSLASDADEFGRYHEGTRGWSPFNFELFARIHRDGGVLLAVRGERVFIDSSGSEQRTPLKDEAARLRFLIEELGLSEELARRVPHDVPTPPPPGSATARAVRAAASGAIS